ncbi:MAG: aminoacetone oxidase family FAD-binding enzyme [Holophaga sp.]|nr:aminoacetone oxidase family FAD-binding enzyme [Holophaga sp.]
MHPHCECIWPHSILGMGVRFLEVIGVGETGVRARTVVVLGGGAAGMIATWQAASLGHAVTMLEANGRLGVKLRISGGGKCNVTHEGSAKELLVVFAKEQARFLRPAFHAFGSGEIRDLLQREGVETYVRENGRVFPKDSPGSAGEVVAAMQRVLERAGVQVRTGARVAGLVGVAPRLEALTLEDGSWVRGDVFILAAGGASYPETGTRGEVLEALRNLGVVVNPWFPALAPIPLVAPRPEWEGVALRDGSLQLHAGAGGKRLATFAGDVVFTRSGISGPAALELSQEVERARRGGLAWLSYALSSLNEELLDAQLQQLQQGNPHLAVRTWLQRLLPERLCAFAHAELALPPDQRMKDLPRAARRSLVAWVRAFPLGEPRAVPLSKGEVAAGGVRLDGIDPRTMAVKGWENLRVCGELLDIDGPIGGYNLQAAFSTGFLAGQVGPSSAFS